jgi:hypothetical protein
MSMKNEKQIAVALGYLANIQELLESMVEERKPRTLDWHRQEHKRLLKKIDHLYETARWGIDHVGYANYAHRQQEAFQRLREAYDAE